MRRLLPALLAALFVAAMARADDARPALPKTPAGFDEGRVKLLRDATEEHFAPSKLIERLFEEADLAELAAFTHSRLLRRERAQLDALLDFKGALAKAVDAAALEKLFRDAKLTPGAAATALGRVGAGAEWKIADVAAWLYARGCNFRLIQKALAGARIDSMRKRRQLREMAAAGKSADAVFESGIWEFNLADAGDHPGGHYDGAQIIEALLAMGWRDKHFQAAIGKYFPEGMTRTQRALIGWGDAALCWRALSQHVAESEMLKAAKAALKADKSGAALDVALRRTRVCDRWFRTGGEGLAGVWSGPLPDSKGEPKPPALPEGIAEAGIEEFAQALSDPLRAHFANAKADALTLAGYADGSARMILDRAGRAAIPYGPDTPPGADGTKQLYEGRYSEKGRIAYAALVYAEGKTVAPADVDLVNVRLLAGGALLAADLDDGVTLRPVLLRRVSRLIVAP
jgi:hypothetical protein